jgi:putative CocE/NonD family hydrolase
VTWYDTSLAHRPERLPGGALWRRVLHVPMRDGVRLVADLYAASAAPEAAALPALPVLLERTPYGRRTPRGSDQDRAGAPVPRPEDIARHFTEAGYHVVRQDCRGRGDSGGTFVKYLGEGPDGVDTLAWLRDQPWCDGRVVMTGVSYSAHVQAAAAAEGGAGPDAMFQDSGGLSCAYDAGMRMGGAFELKQVTWALRHALRSPEAAADPVLAEQLLRVDVPGWFGAMPWRAGCTPLRHLSAYEDYLLEQWREDAFGDYYRAPALYGRGFYERFPDAPSLHLGSWYDPYVRSTIENFTALRALKTAPAHLVMGPWTHGRRCETYAGDVDFGPRATLDGNLAPSYLEFRRRWFDRALGRAGADGDAGDLPVVRYFLMGGGDGRRDAAGRMRHGGAWRTDTRWPPASTAPVALYLTTEGVLTTTPPAVAAASVSFDFDPRHPVPTMGGQVTSGEPVMTGGAYDQNAPDARVYGAREPYLPLDSRPDVISLSTPPLERDVVLAGPVSARLHISTTAPDTDFTVKLIDVHPPNADYPHGFAMNLTDGIVRCRFHRSYEEPEPLVPGEVYEVEVVAPDTANRFAAGHRIRLDVSSSNFPRFDVNTNTAEPEAGARRTATAVNTVHMDAVRPSHLRVWLEGGAAALGRPDRAADARPVRPSGGERGRFAEVGGGRAPGGRHRGVRPPGVRGVAAGEGERRPDVDVQAGAAQRGGDQPRELFGRAAGRDPAGTGLADRDDGRAGTRGEPGQAAAEGQGRGLGGVRARRDPALGVDENRPAALQRGGGEVERLGGARVAPVHGHVPLAGEGMAEQGDAPQTRGTQGDRPDAEPVQRGEHDGGVGERGVVGDDDAARLHHGSGVDGHRETSDGGDEDIGEAAEHGVSRA